MRRIPVRNSFRLVGFCDRNAQNLGYEKVKDLGAKFPHRLSHQTIMTSYGSSSNVIDKVNLRNIQY